MHARRPRLRAAAATAVAAASLGALPAAGSAVVASGHSGWAWTTPSPQGEDISDLAFVGATGYAVGGFGTVLRSNDGGLTWSGLPSGTTQGLARVAVLGAAEFVAAGGCAVRRSDDGGATLARIDVGGGDQGCGTNMRAVAFSDPVNGLLVFDNGVVLSTSDGGRSLSRRTPVPGQVTDVVATSATTAFATSLDAIYRTTDGASSWTLVAQTPRNPPFLLPRILRGIVFASPAVGYAVGDGGTVMKTTDAGATWAAIAGPVPAVDLARARCADESLCLFTISTGASLVRTADGGATYSQVTPAGVPMRAAAFASPTRAVAAGAGGVTVVSDDGGASWRGIGGGLGVDLGGVVARPGGFGYGVGPNSMAISGDGGESWRTFGIPTPRTIAVASFVDPQTGYAQDTGGTLWRTTNGGTSWQVLDPGPALGLFQDIVPLDKGRVLLLTATGVARSTDGGDTFALVDNPALVRSRIVRNRIVRYAVGGSRVFLVGRRGILRSINGGQRWEVLPLPKVRGRTPTIAAGDCGVPSTCWIVTTGSRMFRTANVGRTWTEVTPSVGVPLRTVRQIAAGGPGEAFLALHPIPPVPQGVVLHTVDAGRTWAPQLVNAQPVVSIDAVPGRAWALSGPNRVLTTTSGGAIGMPAALAVKPSARLIRKEATVTMAGRLSAAQGGEQVTLYATGFPARTLTVASGGSFTSVYRLKRTTTFVAQWAGDGVRDGDGTQAVTVELRRAG